LLIVKISPWSPGRFWRKRIGKPWKIPTRIAITIKIGDKINKVGIVITISINRLTREVPFGNNLNDIDTTFYQICFKLNNVALF
jgi:hypothetical protein